MFKKISLAAALLGCLSTSAPAAPFHEKPGSCGYTVNSGFAGITRQAKISADGTATGHNFDKEIHLSPVRLQQVHRLFQKSGFFSWKDRAVTRHPDAASWTLYYDDGKHRKAVTGPGGPPPMASALMKRIDELTAKP